MVSFPLQWSDSGGGEPSADELLERFLEYATSKGLELYPAQEEAILEIFDGKHVILTTPTGSGKSLVAAAMHFRSVALGRRSVYTCPIKALVNEKFLSLCREFGPDNVGMMTGDATVNRDAPILCCTAEILANLALCDGEDADVDDVIMDEFHYYSDRERGFAWQAPLLTLPHCQFLLISATLGDTRFFERDLERLTGVEAVTVTSVERPVPLEFSYVEESLLDTLEKLQAKDRLPVYLVHFTQRSAAETAQNLLSFSVCSKEERSKLGEDLADYRFSSPFGKEIKKLLRNGIGLHHAGLLPKYRILVEQLAQQGKLKVICGTDTLGVGVNVPIRTVLFTQLCKYDGHKTAILAARDFHQISGRAGRRGFDDRGFVVALAPEHVIENKKLEAKAAADPKKKKKLVKKSPPTKGYVHWDEETFAALQKAPPEPLQANFAMTHGVLLNVLSRDGDGCRAMREIIRDSHQTESEKAALRRQGFALFRSLVDREIVEIYPEGRRGPKLGLNIELQDDFSLHQTLSLYLLDTLELLDVDAPDYVLKVLSLVEAILENPDAILRKQLDKLKGDRLAELKAEGVEFDDRMAKLDEMEHPKPERDFIYDTFNQFAEKHPWVGTENIRPKSIAREMFERYASFSEYVKTYGLMRAEGLLLRHLTNTYRVLVHTVPEGFRTEAVDEAIVFFDTLLRTVDASLLEEWEKIRDPDYQPKDVDETAGPKGPIDITRSMAEFTRLVRNEAFKILRLLANQEFAELVEDYACEGLFEDAEEMPRWLDLAIGERMAPYFETHGWIRLDPEARGTQHTVIEREPQEGRWIVRQTLIDVEELNDWELVLEVDLAASRETSTAMVRLIGLGAIG
jgi:superfamily II RNA helicase